MTRYALYFAPSADSPWWRTGCRWLGRDPVSNAEFPQAQIPGIPALVLAKITADARRYGFHATLKAPFELAEGFTESHLDEMAQAFSAAQRPIAIQDLRVRPMDEFLALRPSEPNDEISALAMRCVCFFDLLRAVPNAAQLAKRRGAGLSPRQEALLQRWGYPYVEEEFRFHMTLTDSLNGVDEDAAYAIRKAAEERFTALLSPKPLLLDALTIFRESRPGTPFTVWRRYPFDALMQRRFLPDEGRLFFVVGPSGAGKDSLLQWVKTNMQPDANLVFSQRTITRPAHPSEQYESITQDEYWQLAAAGHFSMQWQVDGICYGVRRGIEADLKAGRDVIVNGSREYVPQLRRLFPEAQVIWVEADANLIRQRIEGRRRESGPALLRRVDRVGQFTVPDETGVIKLDNSGPLEIAGRRLLEILLA